MKAPRFASHYSAEARKGLAVLAVAALAVAAVAYLLLTWHAAETDRLRQAEAENQLVAARAAKASAQGATRLTEADKVAPMFLEGDTPGLVFAGFQSIASDAATAAGLAVKRMQPVDTGDAEGAMPYRLSMDVEGSIEQLRNFLVALEAGLPIVFVTGLEIQPASGEAAAGAGEGDAAAAEQYPSEQLRSTLRIEAYGWRAAP